MIAIPVMRGRVAPVLNWCSRVLIFPSTPEGDVGQEFCAPELGPLERLQVLLAKGVNTLICGALSADLQNRAAELGFKVIPGVAGDIDEVLTAYRQNRLDQPEFWLPGCRGPRRYRQNLGKENYDSITGEQGGKGAMPGGKSGRGAGRGPGGGAGGGACRAAGAGSAGSGPGKRAGSSDFCICQVCGAKAPHERGIPCLQVNCPECGKPMVRE
jgi:predicted Fe-Mo cluster-binding NifX family protein